MSEAAFEVAFEMGDAARRILARIEGKARGGGGGGGGPVWKQIQNGMSNKKDDE